jgi:hypothetical protein
LCGDALAGEGDQLLRELRRSCDAIDRLHHRLHLLAVFLVGHPEDGDVEHLGMGDEDASISAG